MSHYQFEDELYPSMCTYLDVAGMQPHSREFAEYEVNCMRTNRKFELIEGAHIDYTDGIQFTGRP